MKYLKYQNLFLLLFTTGAFAQSNRPNIVLIFADDLGYGDIGCYNSESRIPTPHIDRLAKEGIRFTDAHSADSVCTPSRYGLLTGRYCWRTNLKTGVLFNWEPPMIEQGRATLASLLKANGYRTAIFGKWHLGLGFTAKAGKGYLFNLKTDPYETNDLWNQRPELVAELTERFNHITSFSKTGRRIENSKFENAK